MSCWGDDTEGQLGNGSVVGAVTIPPTGIVFPAGTWATALAAGSYHTCALLNTGDVSCWGDNIAGQLGIGTTVDQPSPTAPIQLPGGLDAIEISAADAHTCAVLTDYRLTCWGSDSSGQLGNGATLTGNVLAPPAPIAMPRNLGVTAVATSALVTCAILRTGQVSCWGNDQNGDLGNGPTVASASAPPTPIKLPNGATAIGITAGSSKISSGSFVCALLSTYDVTCWGSDGYGPLGNGAAGDQNVPPQPIALAADAISVDAGNNHACALLVTGRVSCWGLDNKGQVGDGSPYGSAVYSPVQLTMPGSVASNAVVAGGDHTCAFLQTNNLTCWGQMTSGQLGNGSTTTVVVAPPAVVKLPSSVASGVASMSIGDDSSCLITNAGELGCWGDFFANRPGLVPLPVGSVPISVSAGFEHWCVLLNVGVSCWGSQVAVGNGQGPGWVAAPPAPISMPAGRTPISVAAGYFFSCAVLNTGEVTCWGNPSTLAGQSTAAAVVALPVGRTAIALSAGTYHVCALLDNGQVTCWGSDADGQLGNGPSAGDQATPPAPVVLPAGRSATAVSAGGSSTCALLDNGDVTCWGRDSSGQLGNGATGAVDVPSVAIVLAAPAVSVSMGWNHACAVLNTGRVSCWGQDDRGQQGNGTGGSSTAPQAPITLPGGLNATRVDVGNGHSCALMVNQQLSCWGSNFYGTMGNGGGADSQVPVTTGKASFVEAQSFGVTGGTAVTVAPADTAGLKGATGGLVGDPVNTASGNLIDSHVDLDADAFGLDVVRSYNTFSTTDQGLGLRWQIATGSSLTSQNADVRVTLSDGTPFTFRANQSGGWDPPADFHTTLTTDPAPPSGGGALPMLRLTYQDGTVERFDTTGRLIEQFTWDAQTATSTYDASGRLAKVSSSTGETLTLTYDGDGKLTGAALSSGRAVSYGVNAAGVVSSFTDEFGAATTMSYTPEGWLQTVTAPGAVVTMSNTFDAQGRVLTQTSASGGVTTFAYNFTEGWTNVYDSVTNTSVRYQHDQQGRVIFTTDSYGSLSERVYDNASNLIGGTDRNGASASATYDTNGNLLSTTEPGVGTTSFVYDTLNRVTSMTEPNGATTSYVYDGSERIPSTVTNALAQSTTNDVVGGLVVSTTDADGVTVTYAYDTSRRVTAVSNEYNQTTGYAYDGRGRRTTTTSPSGRVSTSTYDPVTNRLTSTTAADGGITAYTYDTAGRVLTLTDPVGAVTTNTYDTAGRLATVTEPGGAVTSYVYDGNNQLIKTIEPGGGENTTTYGPLDRITATANQLAKTTSYEYDAEGQQTKTTDPAGGVRQTLYDSYGRPYKTIDERNRETVTAYDTYGRVSTVTEPGARVTTTTYDTIGRVSTVTNPRGGAITANYTPGGRLNTTTDPAGLVTSYAYDLAGRNSAVTAPGNLTTSFTYTLDGELATTTSPGGLVTTTTYDPMARVATVTDPAGVVTTNTWSLRGELLTTKVGQQGTQTFTYHPNGTLATATDPLGRITTYAYDTRKNLTSRTAPNGAVNTWTYNAANQLLTAVDPLGRTTTFTYNNAGRTATVTDASGRIVTNTYHPDGTLNTEAFTGGTTTTYTYDAAGRVATMADSTGSYQYAYEAGGNITSYTTPNGRTTSWKYDTAGRRTEIGYPDGTTYAYSYDPAGRPWKVTPGEVLADTFTAANGALPNSNKWTTSTTNGGEAIVLSNVLQLNWTSIASASTTITSKTPATLDSEQVVLFNFNGTTSTNVGKFNVRARHSTSGNIRVEFTSNSTTARIYKQIGTTSTQLGTFTTTVTIAKRWVRLKVVGNNVSVRVWADGTAEPSTWNANLTNATGVTTAGVPRLDVARTSGANQVYIDNYRHTNPTTANTPIATYTYNNDSQLTNETLIGGSRTRAYLNGRLTGFTQTLPGANTTTTRTYDTSGRIATETTGATTTTYGYDNAGQLITATPTTGSATTWTYDQVGQRRTQTVGAATTNYQYDLAGQLCWTVTGTMPVDPTCATTPGGATTFSHDPAGRLTSETVTATDKVTYTYDPVGRLATTQRTNGANTTTQTRGYTPTHQLATLTTSGASTATNAFDWDVTNTASTLTGITTGGVTTGLVMGPKGWIAATTSTGTTAVGQDIYGSTTPTTGTTALARSITYTPFGTPTGTNTPTPQLGYRGELTIDHLTHLRARDYQTTLGRFTTTDPMPGVAGTTTTTNEYHYTDNSPLLNIDPLGLYTVDNSLVSGTGIFAVRSSGAASLVEDAVEKEFWRIVRREFLQGATGIGRELLIEMVTRTPGVAAVTATGLVTTDILVKTFIQLAWTQIYLNNVDKYVDAVSQASLNRAIGVCHPAAGQDECTLDGSSPTPQAVPLVATLSAADEADVEYEAAPQLATNSDGAFKGPGNGPCATNNGRTPTPAEAEAMVRGANPVGSGLNPDAQHAASSFGIDRIASQGSVFRIVGGDGVTRTLIQVPEVDGRYEWIVDDCGNLTHARYIPGGSINGIPNQK